MTGPFTPARPNPPSVVADPSGDMMMDAARAILGAFLQKADLAQRAQEHKDNVALEQGRQELAGAQLSEEAKARAAEQKTARLRLAQERRIAAKAQAAADKRMWLENDIAQQQIELDRQRNQLMQQNADLDKAKIEQGWAQIRIQEQGAFNDLVKEYMGEMQATRALRAEVRVALLGIPGITEEQINATLAELDPWDPRGTGGLLSLATARARRHWKDNYGSNTLLDLGEDVPEAPPAFKGAANAPAIIGELTTLVNRRIEEGASMEKIFEEINDATVGLQDKRLVPLTTYLVLLGHPKSKLSPEVRAVLEQRVRELGGLPSVEGTTTDRPPGQAQLPGSFGIGQEVAGSVRRLGRRFRAGVDELANIKR